MTAPSFEDPFGDAAPASTGMQMSLDFAPTDTPVIVRLGLRGLEVSATVDPHEVPLIKAYLAEVGIEADSGNSDGVVVFTVSQLALLAGLPSHVGIVCDDSVASLYLLATRPCADGVPATLIKEPVGLVLSWWDGTAHWEEVLPASAATALLHSGIPFVFTPEAWHCLSAQVSVPLVHGWARRSTDGHIEIHATAPQLVEQAPIPGLFRLDETHFGASTAYVAEVSAAPGIRWEGQPPRPEPVDLPLANPRFALSAHHQADLEQLVTALAAHSARVIAWDSGLGRRIFALAAVDVLDAYPLVICCNPSSVWVWQRHLDLVGRSHSMLRQTADAFVVTYRDLAHLSRVDPPAAVIYDELTDAEARSPAVRRGLHRFDGLRDIVRIATCSSWSGEPEQILPVMSVLRPGEFSDAVPVTMRYPGNSQQRLAEHVRPYLSTRSAGDPGRDHTPFRRSSVVVVHPCEAQVRALTDIASRVSLAPVHQLLAESLDVVSAGPSQAVSPKVAAAAVRVRRAHGERRSMAVLVRHVRTATLLRATSHPAKPVLVDASAAGASVQAALAQVAGSGGIAIVRYDRAMPDLRAFDQVLVVDYPFSHAVLERAVGSAADEHGPSRVTVIHMAGTVDDRLTLLAAQRRELGHVVDDAGLPTDEEAAYLLARRSA